jgi:hypothetical protein
MSDSEMGEMQNYMIGQYKDLIERMTGFILKQRDFNMKLNEKLNEYRKSDIETQKCFHKENQKLFDELSKVKLENLDLKYKLKGNTG